MIYETLYTYVCENSLPLIMACQNMIGASLQNIISLEYWKFASMENKQSYTYLKG